MYSHRGTDEGGDRSIPIEVQRKGCLQEYSNYDTKIRVKTGVLTSKYRDKNGAWSTHIEVKR